MASLKLDHTIELDQNGKHVLVFPERFADLKPPRGHREKMEWIRASFAHYYERICELRALGYQ